MAVEKVTAYSREYQRKFTVAQRQLHNKINDTVTTQSSTITIINNGWVIKNNASDWPHPKGGDSLYLAWDNLSAIWNRPAMLMQWPIPPKYLSDCQSNKYILC